MKKIIVLISISIFTTLFSLDNHLVLRKSLIYSGLIYPPQTHRGFLKIYAQLFLDCCQRIQAAGYELAHNAMPITNIANIGEASAAISGFPVQVKSIFLEKNTISIVGGKTKVLIN